MGLLSQYRMLDLSRLFPGPYASHVLADMGMDVVKVEEPAPRGGMGRDVLTPPVPTPEGERHAAAFNVLARNKRSIALDLHTTALRPRPQEVFYELVKGADVVLEGYRPGALKWMGIDYETLRRHNPRIIVCSISGFGQSGPYERVAGHDLQYLSVAGMVDAASDRAADTALPGVPLGDLTSGLWAAVAILGALVEREQSGQGQHLDVSMLGAVMSLSVNRSTRYFRDGETSLPGRGSTVQAVFRCRDGLYLSTGNAESHFWANFCQVLERPQYVALRGQPPSAATEAMMADLRAVFLEKDRDDWLRILWAADTCAAPVHDVAAAFVDPQVKHIGMAWDYDHPTEGRVQQLGFPVTFSRTAVGPERFAPILGEHTREVLSEAGFSAAGIADLESSKVVRSWTGDGWTGGR